MNNHVNEFIVNSKGLCFFCLSNQPDPSSALYTIQCLSDYLKMDLTKVFSQKESIHPSLLAKVEQSKLKTELCAACASLATNFSRLYQQFEKLKMEMDYNLGHIQEKLLMAEKLRTRDQMEEDEGLMEVLEVLRKETLEKCSSKICCRLPRVTIQKLSKKAVKAQISKIEKRKNKARTEPIRDTGCGSQSQSKNDVTMENPNEDSAMDDEDRGNTFLDDTVGFSDKDQSMEPTATAASDVSENVEEESFHASNVTVGNSGELKYSINPETGMYKCKICAKEFRRSGFDYHYKSVHLKIRYKCNLCGKIFTRKPHYNRHLKRDHLGVTYRCGICDQQG